MQPDGPEPTFLYVHLTQRKQSQLGLGLLSQLLSAVPAKQAVE